MSNKVLIWDLPTRLFHWALVVCMIGTWATAEYFEDSIDLHMQFGYVTLGLIIFRMIWGFVGSKYAKFGQFFPTPNKVKNYLSQFNDEKAPHTAGHNPLGALMVFLLLLLVLLQAISGLFMDDEIFSSGPYFNAAGAWVDDMAGFIHHNVFDVLLGAIGLHIAAVLFYKFKKKQDLVTPMITGEKDADQLEQGAGIESSKWKLGLLLAIAVAFFVYWLVAINPPAPVMDDMYF